ncbi:hypothetical protein BJX76DRAFT_354364 [Aspergillus varians]
MAYRLLDQSDIQGFRAYRAILPKPVKRSSSTMDDDDFEPIYSVHRSSHLSDYQERNWTTSPIPEFPGVTADDLPIAPFETTNPILVHYLDLPLMSNLDWRLDETGNPKRRDLGDTRALIAGFVQTRGQLAETPCASCTQG